MEKNVRKGIGLTLILASIATLFLIAFVVFRADYWLMHPKEKFLHSWQEDVKLLEATNKLPKEWQEIGKVALSSDNSPAQHWLENIRPPIQIKKDGQYRLDVFVIHWIEDTRYGAVVQYNIVDMKTQNTIWELGRTFKLGYIY